MGRSVTVFCSGDIPLQIRITYSIETVENLQTIACSVADTKFPAWLQLRKFEMLSIREKNGYVPLFNEVNNSKNMATSLFIDQAYADIMTAEKLKVIRSAN